MKTSILLITYNHEEFIEEAISSILAQKDCGNFEIILSDDCSKDSTFRKAKVLLESQENVSFHRNEVNLGITKNYQQAFKRCKGEYIFVLEGDDYWTDEYKMRTQIDFLDSNPDCVMCGHPFFVLRDGSMVPFGIDEKKGKFIFFNSEDLIQNEGIVSNFSTCCYRRSALERISDRVYDVISYDWMINISIGQFGKLGKINQAMSFYRISLSNTWANKTEYQKTLDLYEIVDLYDSALLYKYSDSFKNKQRELGQKLNVLRSHNQASDKRRPFIYRLIQKITN